MQTLLHTPWQQPQAQIDGYEAYTCTSVYNTCKNKHYVYTLRTDIPAIL